MTVAHTFLADISRHRGPSEPLIRSVRAYVDEKYGGAEILWYVRSDQESLVGDFPYRIQRWQADSGTTLTEIGNWIRQLSRNGHASHAFHLLSYDPAVLNGAERLSDPATVVAPMHFAVIQAALNERSGDAGPFQSGRPTVSGAGLSLTDAVSLAKRVLRQGQHTRRDCALPQKSLRVFMTALDPRARKNSYDPLSARLISEIVRAGLEEGWLDQAIPRMGDEMIWLKESANEVGSPSRIGLAPFSVPAGSDRIETRQFSIMQAADDPNPSVADAEAKSVEASVGADPSRGGSIRKSRPAHPCDEMEKILMDQGVFATAIARAFLFEATEQLLLRDPQEASVPDCLSASQLGSQIPAVAEELATAAGMTRPVNWRAVAKCFVRLMGPPAPMEPILTVAYYAQC